MARPGRPPPPAGEVGARVAAQSPNRLTFPFYTSLVSVSYDLSDKAQSIKDKTHSTNLNMNSADDCDDL